MRSGDLINWTAVGKHLGSSDLRRGRIPDKYSTKVKVLLMLIDLWVVLIKNEDLSIPKRNFDGNYRGFLKSKDD